MPKIIIATSRGGGASTINVSDPANAVRLVSPILRKHLGDNNALSRLQQWANTGFKKSLDIRSEKGVITITYYE